MIHMIWVWSHLNNSLNICHIITRKPEGSFEPLTLPAKTPINPSMISMAVCFFCRNHSDWLLSATAEYLLFLSPGRLSLSFLTEQTATHSFSHLPSHHTHTLEHTHTHTHAARHSGAPHPFSQLSPADEERGAQVVTATAPRSLTLSLPPPPPLLWQGIDERW